jgi:hypothetical protein
VNDRKTSNSDQVGTGTLGFATVASLRLLFHSDVVWSGDIIVPAILANSPLEPNKLRFGSTALAEDQPVGQGGKAGEGLRFSQPLALVEGSGLSVGVGGCGRTEALKRLINFRVIGR